MKQKDLTNKEMWTRIRSMVEDEDGKRDAFSISVNDGAWGFIQIHRKLNRWLAFLTDEATGKRQILEGYIPDVSPLFKKVWSKFHERYYNDRD